MIFAEDKIIAAKLGKRYLSDNQGVITGTLVGGLVGGIVGAAADKHTRQKREDKVIGLTELAPEEILGMDKDNFEIAYEEIEKVEMFGKTFVSPVGTLRIEGNVATALRKTGNSTTVGLFRKKPVRDLLVEIGKNQDFGECRKVVSAALKDKLTTKTKGSLRF